MKAPLLLSALLVLCGLSSSFGQSEKEPAPGPKNTEEAKSAKPVKLDLVRFRGKTGKPSTNVKVSTRAGDQSAIRIVAISPGNEGITFKSQPRLWWHQNEPTQPGELEFVLTRLGNGAPTEVLRRPVPKMKVGYNVIDLANRHVNPDALTLENAITYQWTLNLRSGITSSPVYSRVTLNNNRSLPATSIPTDERLRTLGEQGNWYELFDLTCTGAEQEIPAGPMNALRAALLTDINLIGEIK